MFGGLDSTGFKIKWKNLEKFGARIIALQARSERVHYCVVRSDIPHGNQLAQIVHAAGESSDPKPVPGTVAVALHAIDEKHLEIVSARLDRAGIRHYCVREAEDDRKFPGQMMSIGVPPTTDREAIKKVLGSLPLAK